MKLIAVNRVAGRPLESLHAVELYPDSAPVGPGKPVFLPDWMGDVKWSAVIAPAFRIGRLGKAIKPRFASRYIDKVALGARLYPSNSPITPSIARPSLVYAWDGAVALGEWIDYTPGLTVAPDAAPALSLTLDEKEIDIEGMIADISAVMTLKTGDVIMPCFLEPPMGVAVGDTIKYQLNGHAGELVLKIR